MTTNGKFLLDPRFEFRDGVYNKSLLSLSQVDLNNNGYTANSSKLMKIHYKDELILYFFNAMLESIVDKWEPIIEEMEDSIGSGDAVITPRDYIQLCSDEDTEDEQNYMSQSQDGKNDMIHSQEDISNLSPYENRSIRSFSKGRKSKKRKFSIIRKRKTKQSDLGPAFNELGEPELDTAWMLDHTEEKAEITFKNGNIYEGSVFRKKMHGFGKFKWRNGTVYTGEFKDGQIMGTGHLVYGDKSYYKGQFVNNIRHGFGVCYPSQCPSVYKGFWKAGLKNGLGWLLFEPNNWYEGSFENNFISGYGIRCYGSGAKYHGEFKINKRHGHGEAVFSNNDFYTGSWYNGKRHGLGDYTWKAFFNKNFVAPCQNRYFGSWHHDEIHGCGVMNFGWLGGGRYAGFYHKNEKHGVGVIICSNGEIVEYSPLFINDKPVHVTESGELNKSTSNLSSQCDDEDYKSDDESQKESSTFILTKGLEARFTLEARITLTQTSSTSLPRNLAQHEIDISSKGYCRNPSTAFAKENIAQINLCAIEFMPYKDKYMSMPISMLNKMETIELKAFLDVIVKNVITAFKILGLMDDEINLTNFLEESFKTTSSLVNILVACVQTKTDKNAITGSKYKLHPVSIHTILETERTNFLIPQQKKVAVSEGSRSTMPEYIFNFHKCEERLLRKAITKYLSKLYAIYNQYTVVACMHETLPFKPWLMRIQFWQLWRDCKIPECGVSLIEIDNMLAYPTVFDSYFTHNPFEIIYFWQFLRSCINIAWKLYGESYDYFQARRPGVFLDIFEKFIHTHLFPNTGHHRGSALFDYKDVLPIDTAYNWYKTFGEPHTVMQFINNTCGQQKRDPASFYFENNSYTPPGIQMGINIIPFANIPIYVPENEPDSLIEELEDIIPSFSHGNCIKQLFFLRKLSSKKILEAVHHVCPHIKEGKDFINLNYQLAFLEFYEIILLCTQEKINRETFKKEKHRKPEVICLYDGIPRELDVEIELIPKKSQKHIKVTK